MFEDEPEGATPLDPDAVEDLLPSHIRTREELNLWEQENILEAARWAERTTMSPLEDSTVRELHRRMFDRTWRWAGPYRTSETTVGVYWATIPEEVHKLVEDGRYWLEHGTFGLDESALRLHHRLVRIHPFPNGNGRHARLWCDMLLRQNARAPFGWKSEELDKDGKARQAYIQALRAADGHDYEPLFALILRGRTRS